MASGGIRKQLGPCKKRLKDRIDEAALLIQDDNITPMKAVRTKLVSNIAHHAKLISKLEALVDVNITADEREIIEDELEKRFGNADGC